MTDESAPVGDTIGRFRDAFLRGQEVRELAPGYLGVVTARGIEPLDIRGMLPKPPRKSGTFVFADRASFLAYVREHNEQSATSIYRHDGGTASDEYAKLDPPRFLAILNGHARDSGDAGHADHRAVLELHPSIEWEAWVARAANFNGGAFSQAGFAEFLEDHSRDVHEPDAATLVEVARKFSATRTIRFSQVQRIASGDVELTYAEETTATTGGANATATVPERFKLGLRPWIGAEPYEVWARLKYRLDGNGNLTIRYDLERLDLVLETALSDESNAIEAAAAEMHLDIAQVLRVVRLP